jgi:hypothetical protein
MKKIAFTMMAFLMLVSTGLAQKGASAGDFRRTVELQATPHGSEYSVEGQAIVAQRNGIQYFSVQCIAGVDDGTVFVVRATTGEGWFKVGTITMFEKRGQLLLQSSSHALSPVFPITSIQSVSLYDLGGMLAEASF